MNFQIPNSDAGYYPEVISLLQGIECSNVEQKKLGLYHPADVFYFSFMDVIDSSLRLLERLSSDTLKKKNDHNYTPR